MTTQPEALRLANILEKMPLGQCDEQAAAELRRLHEVNQELLEALKEIMSWEENEQMTWAQKARAAIAKATGEQA
jgi:mevalonate kinase